jgi:hypothetical protein
MHASSDALTQAFPLLHPPASSSHRSFKAVPCDMAIQALGSTRGRGSDAVRF